MKSGDLRILGFVVMTFSVLCTGGEYSQYSCEYEGYATTTAGQLETYDAETGEWYKSVKIQ